MVIKGEVMPGKPAKWLGALLLCGAIMIGLLYATRGRSNGERGRDLPEEKTERLLVMAHRGGAGLWPENTMLAFERARELGVDVIETDVHSTADGVLVVIHDATIDRTTNGAGRVGDLTLAQVKKLDAGYRWSADAMKTFPWRGQGLSVPTLDEVLTRFPEMRFNIEPKQEQPSLAQPLCRMLREKGMVNKIVIGSFSQTVLNEFRRECPEVATSASPSEVGEFIRAINAGRGAVSRPVMKALQVPEYVGGRHVLTKALVDAAHAQNLQVHAWTVNETEDMRRLISIGVDGIMTDYPNRLLTVLGR
jgi:glycerophosphoryl diester phosphodiesterase